jgi:hypothetical protein
VVLVEESASRLRGGILWQRAGARGRLVLDGVLAVDLAAPGTVKYLGFSSGCLAAQLRGVVTADWVTLDLVLPVNSSSRSE